VGVVLAPSAETGGGFEESGGDDRPRPGTESFEEFYAVTAKPLWRYVQKVAGDADLADDIVQEAYVRYLARVGDIEPAGRKAYLFRIAANLMTDHFRRSKRRRTLMRESAVPAMNEEGLPTKELQGKVHRVLGRLSLRERSLLWMAHAEGFRHREIAETLGLKEASVRVLLFRARRKVARLLKAVGFEPGPLP
jgi:RNA polymerase sigma-70 factor (ECF subfamily)